MDSRGGDGMEANGSIGPDFYNNHHNYLYENGGGIKYTMSPAFQNEFAFAPQPDASTLAFNHQQQQQQQQQPQTHLQYSTPPSYSPQPNIRSPVQQHSQPQFDPYSQHLRQHVRPSSSTISPAQLQPPQAYTQAPLNWEDLSLFNGDLGHHQPTQHQQITPAPESTSTPPIHRTTLIAPTLEQQQQQQRWLSDSTGMGTSMSISAIPVNENASYLAGCYWCTVEPESNVPEPLTENLHYFWRMKIEEAGNKPSKSQKRSSSQALPQSPVETNDAKRTKIDKPAKAVPAKKVTRAAAAAPLPVDPVEKLREQVSRLFKNPDLSDSHKFSMSFWDIMHEAGTDPDKRLVVIRTAFKEGSPEVFKTFAKNITVPGRLQQWIAQIWNSDKGSSLLPLCLKMALSTSELQATALLKTVEFLRRRKTYATISDLAEQVIDNAEKLEQQYAAANATGEKKESPSTEDKSLTKPVGAGNAGVKRSREEADNGGKADGSVKKASVAAPAAAKPTPPGQVVKAVGPLSQVKPSPTNGASAVSAIAPIAKPKVPTASTTSSTSSAFFKSVAGRTPAPPKPTVTPPASNTKVQGYSSIFDQLRERQKKDEEEAAMRLKTGKAPEKEEELTKKGKKKKTVRWKPEGELAQISLFQVLEPIGEYYGGGDGRGHVFGDARSLDVEEGKDALAALKNRKALDEEDEIYIDWYQPIAIDFTELQASPDYEAETMSIRRGGTKAVESEQAEIQTKRETGILSVQYMTLREIPPSPEEPAEEPRDGAAGGQWKQIPVPEHLRVEYKNSLIPQQHNVPVAPNFDLSSILSQIQPQVQPVAPKPPPVAAPVDSIAAILAQVQALSGASQAVQPQQQAPMPIQEVAPPQPSQPANNLLAILSTLNAGNQAQQQQPQQQAPPPPQPPQPQPTPVADFSQLWLQLAQQQQQQQQMHHQPQQPQTQVTDLIAILTGQQQQQQQQHQQNMAAANFSGLQMPNMAAAWNPYAAWTAAAAAAAAAAATNGSNQGIPNVNNMNISDQGQKDNNSGQVDEFGRNSRSGSSSGKDVRERLREQAGWTDPGFLDAEAINPSGGGGGRDRDSGGNTGGGGNIGTGKEKWKKDKWGKKKKKQQQQQQQQQQNQQQQNGAGGGEKGLCKFWGKGQCTTESCRYSHAGDEKYPADPSTVQNSGGGGGGGKRWKDRKRGGHGHGGHGHGHGGHHGGGGGGKLDAEAGRSEWIENLEY
ncbi:hypothetical protein DFH27DRAFT_605840 [Peziza echinospora]|nr:hypothetical protein DFH27DRAFT_605840 [Peziza echinospora]